MIGTQPDTATKIQSPHILVVDDNPEIAESLGDYLIRQNYHVSAAYSGAQALEFLEESSFTDKYPVDLILLDMIMPEMSGFEMLQKLRAHSDPDLSITRVIVLTGASSSKDKVEALNGGADDYITKPYQPQELLARLHTHLRTQQLEREMQHQRSQLARLNRVGQEMARTHERRHIVSLAVRAAQSLLNCEAVALFLPNKSREYITCQLVGGKAFKSDQYAQIPFGQGIIGQTAARPAVFRLNGPHIAQDGAYSAATDIPPGMDLHSILTVPVINRGQTWAVLAAFNHSSQNFTEFDLDLIASLSTFMGSAYDNSTLLQNLRRQQRELLDSRNSLQAIIDGILHPIYTINEQWQIVSLNDHKAAEAQGEANQIIGQSCYQAFFGRLEPCEHCQVAQTIQEGGPQNWSVQWMGDDRLPREWDVNTYPIPGQSIGSPSAVVVWQDRTEERRLERSLLQAGKLAAIGQLAAGVAHEINNPLTAINANAELMLMTQSPDTDDFEAVDLILRAGQRAAHVVKGLLDFAREQQYTFIPLDLNKTVDQALDLVAYQMHTSHVAVQKELGSKLPAVMASSEHIKSVWINLMINARDAMRDAAIDQPKLEITTRLAPAAAGSPSLVEVIIRDNGPGMLAAEAAHIFEPFYTTKDPGKGTGLGLATCHRIIQQHGGFVEVITNPGEGATFVVRLPTTTET